jgi:hypothetical protein
VLLDLVGKGKRVRSVPMPGWAKAAADRWTEAAATTEGRVLRAVNKGDRVVSDRNLTDAPCDRLGVHL